MKKSTLLFVAIAAGSLALGGLLMPHTKAQAGPGGAAATQPPEPPTDPTKVVITIGETKITAGEFQTFVNSLPPEVRALAKGDGKRTLGEEYVRLKLLAGEAQRRSVQDSAEFKQQMQIMRDNLLVGLLAQQIGGVVSDAEIKAYYDAHKSEFEQVKARHILIPIGGDRGLTDEQAKAKAQEVRNRLDKGEKFADLAKAESADPGTKDDGGELQPFTKGVMVPEFEAVAFALKPGETSQPVKTDYGYHIIQVEKHDIPPLDDMDEAIGDKLRQQNFEKFYDQLKEKANPTFDSTFFPPAKAPAKDK